ncbi:SIS domain-containing protein [Dysgonomonas sp. 216]|uniref:D-sedoheptulose-7-phosphate isomerase n=1 Tax=Dysgonomonas sp. 216 TaxID=2302934 RepID=UPI0013D38813|nr:D-sedoheptulose 7-phosphate isomerase [Dysgonomonas sp. 216]NDW18067.1 SIS domain-containing protein [Dysgonomonas sp. 216]
MDIIRNRLLASIEVKQDIVQDMHLINQIKASSDIIIKCFQNNGSVYFCGNGGSAADAQHLAAELSGRFYFDREPLSSDALHCNTSFLTAVGNDYSFDDIYSRLIKGIGRKGDVLVGLSTSGNSKNIVNAIDEAKKRGIYTIAFTGKSGGKLRNLADICICIPSDDTPRIQESHITIGHIMCEIIESSLFSKK